MESKLSARRVLLALGLVVLVGACATSAMSIEADPPVKVTHRNSGPRYDIDRDEDDDRSKLTPVVGEQAPQAPRDTEMVPSSNSKPGDESADGSPLMGHIHIRRVFLVPMMRPMRPDNNQWQQPSEGNNNNQDNERATDSAPAMFAKPFWPFLTPARPSHHLFGADEASRSPSEQDPKAMATNNVPAQGDGGEREGTPPPQHGETGAPMFDPIQMMMELMQQALAGQTAPMTNPSTDLNKDASSSGDERPMSPIFNKSPANNQNETRDDIVEIEGKKFLRKTVISRHVGENIIFMTKRLIFVPLNETESAEPTTTVADEKPAIPTTTERVNEDTTTTTTSSTTASPVVENKEVTEKPIEEATTTTTSTTSEQPPVTSEVQPEQPTTTTTTAETTRAKESWVDRVTDAIDKAAERMVESAQPEATTTTTTTSKPSN